jgi:hypothetical protein
MAEIAGGRTMKRCRSCQQQVGRRAARGPHCGQPICVLNDPVLGGWAWLGLLASPALAQQLTTRPADTVESLRRQVADLRSIIAMLRKENADLKTKLTEKARPQPLATPAQPIAAAIKAHKVVEGMTKEQVAQSLNHLRNNDVKRFGVWNVGWEKSTSTDGMDQEVWSITYGNHAVLVRQVTVVYDKSGVVARATETIADTAFNEPDFAR